MVRPDMTDSSPAKISRRYSDFSHLNTALRRQYPALMRDISFPGKRLRGNFKPSTIARRSRAFEQYLTHVFAVGALRTSAELSEFLYGDDLREGYRRMVDGSYTEALAPLRSAWRLQAHLHGDTDSEVLYLSSSSFFKYIAMYFLHELMNYMYQMEMGLVTWPGSDCITGHNAFSAGLLKLLPALHKKVA